MMCTGYVSSSASMRIRLRFTRTRWRYKFSSLHSGPVTCRYFSSSGLRYFTKERLRHMFISNSSDWLSSSARPRSRPTGWSRHFCGRPRSYIAWPGLVHGAEQPGERVARIEARRHANVPRHAFREGMLAFVEPAAIEGESQRLENIHRQRPLARHAELARERQGRAVRLDFDGLVDKARELARQGLEDRVDVRRGNARRESVDQGIVGCEAARLTQQGGPVAHQMHHLFQVRRQDLEVVGLARLDPEHLGASGGLGQARDQRGWRGNGMVALAAHFPQVGHLPILQLR